MNRGIKFPDVLHLLPSLQKHTLWSLPKRQIPRFNVQRVKVARVKKEDTLFEDTSEDTFEDTFGDTFNDLPSFNYPLRTLLIASCCCGHL